MAQEHSGLGLQVGFKSLCGAFKNSLESFKLVDSWAAVLKTLGLLVSGREFVGFRIGRGRGWALSKGGGLRFVSTHIRMIIRLLFGCQYE